MTRRHPVIQGRVPSDTISKLHWESCKIPSVLGLRVDDGQVGGYSFVNISPRIRRGWTLTAFPSAWTQVERLRPVALIKGRPMPIKRWCVCEQIFLPQSVLEDFNPEAAVVSEQSELQPPWHATRIPIDWARKAERPGILIAVPFHQPIGLSLF